MYLCSVTLHHRVIYFVNKKIFYKIESKDFIEFCKTKKLTNVMVHSIIATSHFEEIREALQILFSKVQSDGNDVIMGQGRNKS